jgi:H/ACA ribonucleoprotein complex subunit 4
MRLPSDVKRETLVRFEEKTFLPGQDPYARTIPELFKKGVINLDKPSGPTSHEVVSWVKSILELPRAGHSGTLDPHVTGVLPTMLSEATGTVRSLLMAGKEYVCVMRLHKDVSPARITAAMKEFEGTLYQRPPLVSAVKRVVRKRTIYYIDVIEIEGRDVLFRVGCEAGTYIRKLCHDIGEAMGTGAHMYELRRTRSGPFMEDETLVTLHKIKDAYIAYKETGDEAPLRKCIYPMEFGLRHLPRIVIKDSAVDALAHGAPLFVQGICTVETGIQPNDMVVAYTHAGEAVSIGYSKLSTDALMKAADGQAMDTMKVLMKPCIYPMKWKKKTT